MSLDGLLSPFLSNCDEIRACFWPSNQSVIKVVILKQAGALT